MTRPASILLLVAWIVGAVTGGVHVQPDPPAAHAEIRVVAETRWAQLGVRADRIVMTVGHGMDRWRAAATVPPFVHNWIHTIGNAGRGDGRTTTPESWTSISL